VLSCRELAENTDRYLDGELPFWARIKVRFHLALCQNCCRYVDQLRLAVAALRRAAPDEPPHAHVEAVADRALRAVQTAGEVSGAAAAHEIVIYTTPWCPYCRRAKALLRRKHVAFREIDVAGDPIRRREMTALASGRTTVPQIFIGGRGIGGCDELHALDAAGELDRLLGRA